MEGGTHRALTLEAAELIWVRKEQNTDKVMTSRLLGACDIIDIVYIYIVEVTLISQI